MKDHAIEILRQEFQVREYFGAVYLWGSITTDEFDPNTSDIDAIGIVQESTPTSEKEVLNKSLSAQISQLKINFLYPSELNGGPVKETLARFIPIECILYDMPFWIHIAGEKFKKEDFILGQKTIDEVVAASLSSLRARFLPEPKKEDLVYFMKALAKLCYFIHQKNCSPKPFRYSELIEDATDETRVVCDSIVKIKDSRWDIEIIKNNLPLFIEFISNF